MEFEYFINPEWKYYKGILEDKTTLHILSSGKVLFDTNESMKRLKEKAIEKISEYSPQLSDQKKKDYAFHLETIKKDGEDLFERKQMEDFSFFTGSKINFLADTVCLLKAKLPVYIKYGITELKEIDSEFTLLLSDFLTTDLTDLSKGTKWSKLCDYVYQNLGEINIKSYKSLIKLV